MKNLYFLLFLCFSCKPEITECTNFGDENIYPPYKINVQEVTPSGIKIDTGEQEINLDTVDRLVDDVVSCLNQKFPNGLTEDVIERASCYNFKPYYKWAYQIRPLNKDCITIKIPNTWKLSCDGTQQLLDRYIDKSACQAKGLNRDFDECPCSWRAGIQEHEVIVTTPDLHMLPDPIVRYMTGCSMIWVGELANCARPRTIPLTGEWRE